MNSPKISENDKREAARLELRSDQLTDILGQVPRWLVRNGTIIILLIVICLILGAAVLRYPDVLQARIILTTQTPPADISSKISAPIKDLNVSDKQFVKTDQVLMVLESSAKYEDVLYLAKNLVLPFNPDSLSKVNFKDDMDLGLMQETYAALLKKIQEYISFKSLNYHQRKISLINLELKKYNSYLEKLKDQERVLFQDYSLARKQYTRDSLLHVEGVISSVQLEKSEGQKLGKLYDWKETQTELASGLIKISDLQQEILELELNQEEENRQYIQSLQEVYEKLKGEIGEWNQLYLIRSPFDGQISLTKIWTENQYVEKGDVVITVLPENQGSIIGKIFLPATGIGKIKEGFKVIIRFDNYPFMEFGTISGTISSISLVPNNEEYAIEVKLENEQLITNYDIKLNFHQNMPGVAEIITNERSLLQRIIDPFYSAYHNQKNMSN